MLQFFDRAAGAGCAALLACSFAAVQPAMCDSFGPLKQVFLADPAIGIQNAMSVPIPADWKFEGRIVRDVPCSPGDAFPQMQATSANGAYVMTVMTPFFTTSQPTDFDLRTCGAVAPLMSAADVLVHYVLPAIRHGARTSPPETVPDTDRFLKSANRSVNGVVISGDAARVRVSYTHDGQNVEEYVIGLTTQMRHAGWPGGTSSTLVQIIRAPAGKLDEFMKQAAAMRAEPNPEWQQRNQQLAQQAAQQAQQRGAQQRAAILQNGQDAGAAGRAALANTRAQIQATGQASMDNAARSEAARHAGAVGTADYVGGRPSSVYFFCDGNGGTRTNNNPNPPGPGWTLCH